MNYLQLFLLFSSTDRISIVAFIHYARVIQITSSILLEKTLVNVLEYSEVAHCIGHWVPLE